MNKRILVISGALILFPFWLAFSQSMNTTSFTDTLATKSASDASQSVFLRMFP
jgi:hypothetical protein